jgi:uncharacterized protein YozE (UPF0346 family)
MKVIISENQLKLIVEDKKKSKKKDDFDRISFYLEYYKNLTPSDFKVSKKDDEIIIKIPKN